MKRRSLRYWLLLLLFLAVGYGGSLAWRQYRAYADTSAQSRQELRKLETFELTDQHGKVFRSDQLRGNVWVASFFFTACPSECPRLTRALAELQTAFPELHLVSITCDPETDTPAVLAQYAAKYGADPQRWKFLTGDLDKIQHIANRVFQVGFAKASHSNRVFLIDRDGNIRTHLLILEPGQPERMKKILRTLSVEPS